MLKPGMLVSIKGESFKDYYGVYKGQFELEVLFKKEIFYRVSLHTLNPDSKGMAVEAILGNLEDIVEEDF